MNTATAERSTRLALTRKPGESITVDGPATFKVMKITGNRVQIVIESPESTRIMRAELIDFELPPPPEAIKKAAPETTEAA